MSMMITWRQRTEPAELYGMFWHPTFMIVVKLCRTLVSPKVGDHWRDIQGYAQLALDSLGGEEDELSDQ